MSPGRYRIRCCIRGCGCYRGPLVARIYRDERDGRRWIVTSRSLGTNTLKFFRAAGWTFERIGDVG